LLSKNSVFMAPSDQWGAEMLGAGSHLRARSNARHTGRIKA